MKPSQGFHSLDRKPWQTCETLSLQQAEITRKQCPTKPRETLQSTNHLRKNRRRNVKQLPTRISGIVILAAAVATHPHRAWRLNFPKIMRLGQPILISHLKKILLAISRNRRFFEMVHLDALKMQEEPSLQKCPYKTQRIRQETNTTLFLQPLFTKGGAHWRHPALLQARAMPAQFLLRLPIVAATQPVRQHHLPIHHLLRLVEVQDDVS